MLVEGATPPLMASRRRQRRAAAALVVRAGNRTSLDASGPIKGPMHLGEFTPAGGKRRDLAVSRVRGRARSRIPCAGRDASRAKK